MDILNTFSLKKYKGEVGIEVEVEGCDLPEEVSGWRREEDFSLKTDECAEYVTNKPVKFDDAKDFLKKLDDAFSESGGEIYDSIRAGVHIHINVQGMTSFEVVKFAATYYCVEEILTDYCGYGRAGNLFCLRSRDADFILDCWQKVFDNKSLSVMYTDNIRYSSMNLKPISEYGSVEFRALKTPQNLNEINDWVSLLKRVRDFSLTLKTGKELMSDFSMNSTQEFLKNIFGEDLKLLEHLLHNEHEVRKKLLRGIRFAQDVLFLGDWKTLDEKALEVVKLINLAEPGIIGDFAQPVEINNIE